MSIKIDDFKSGLKTGLQRANKYRVAITHAAAAGSVPAADMINLTADSVTLPGRNISTQEFAAGRETQKNPYTFIDDDVTISFLMTNDFVVRRFFDTWMSKIVDTDNYTVGYKSEYAGTVTVEALDYNGTPIYGTTLLRAFPINIGGIEYANASENTVAIMPVTFAYDRYEVF